MTDLLYTGNTLMELFCTALLSVYDKTGLIDLAKDLHDAGVRLLGSGGTAKKIRDEGIPIELDLHSFNSQV